MHMNRFRYLIISLSLIVCMHVDAYAQLESSQWFFGDHCGLDFRGGAPVARTDGGDYTWEGTSTISDPATGQLLFHTDGDTVWNRNWQIMANGTNLGGHNSSTQAALIIPMPDDPTKFYIVSTDAGLYHPDHDLGGGAAWSIVDMTLNGGLGEVTTNKVMLHTPVTEKVAAIPHCNGRGYWVLLHERSTDRYLVYYLSKHGFEGPTIQSIGSVHGGPDVSAIGGMKFTRDGTRLATAIFAVGSGVVPQGTIDLFDFDRSTGTLSNAIMIDVDDNVYDVCFSPDGSRLYATGAERKYLAQYDVSRGNAAQIEASRTVLMRTGGGIAFENMAGIQMGNDGRIYVSIQGLPQLGVITRPNALGAVCGYVHRSLALSNRFNQTGLPNYIYGMYDKSMRTCPPPRSLFDPSAIEICAGDSITYTDRSYDDPRTWQWTFEGGEPSVLTTRTPGTVRYPVAGTYTTTQVTSNQYGSDTFAITITVNPRPVIDAGETRNICIGSSVQLALHTEGSYSFRWSPSAGLSCTTCAEPIASPRVTTRYTVVATSDRGCTTSDELTIVVDPYPVTSAGRDVALCIGDSVQLQGTGGTQMTWSPSTGLSCTSCANPIASPRVSTTYTLATSDNGRCISYDSMRVTVNQRPNANAGDDKRICQGEFIPLSANGGVRYEWSPSTGLSCDDCQSPIASPGITTTYTVRAFNANGCPDTDDVTITVDPAPRLVHAGLGPDQDVYPGTELELPVVLDEPLDAAAVSAIDIVIQYDPTIMHLLRATLDSTLTEGWTVIVTSEDMANGTFSARLFATGGVPLTGSGILARLRFQSYINFGDSSTARLTMSLLGKQCTRVETRPVTVRLDSVCGLAQRLIESSAFTYALEQNIPNPFNPSTVIDFSLGLDARTVMEILDSRGHRVARLIDAHLVAGAYSVTWDASAQPSGLYYCRLASGTWTRTIAMTVVK